MMKPVLKETAGMALAFTLVTAAKVAGEFLATRIIPTAVQVGHSALSAASWTLLPVYAVAMMVDKIGYKIAELCGDQAYKNAGKTRLIVSVITIIAAVGVGMVLGASPLAAALVAIAVILKSVLTKPSIEQKIEMLNQELESINNKDNSAWNDTFATQMKKLEKKIEELNDIKNPKEPSDVIKPPENNNKQKHTKRDVIQVVMDNDWN